MTGQGGAAFETFQTCWHLILLHSPSTLYGLEDLRPQFLLSQKAQTPVCMMQKEKSNEHKEGQP